MDRQARPLKDAPDASNAPHPETIVLDTNAVLDWLVFRETALDDLTSRLADARVRWLSCPAMRTELMRVLQRPCLVRYDPDSERTLAQYDQWASVCVNPQTSGAPRLRCRDEDDQVFLDLALRERAGWLLTRDRDLLCLARKTLPLGLKITRPEVWRAGIDSPTRSSQAAVA
jgi:uncharacterized protein